MNDIPRMMTIRQVAALGVLPEHTLRRLHAKGRLPCIEADSRVYVNLDLLLTMLNQPPMGGKDHG